MDRDVGGMAEVELERWALQAGVTPNRASRDLEGWDYLLQFPFREPQTGAALDNRPARIECLVQVKGLGTKRSRISIKLRNWEKLVKSPLPAFFLVIDYGALEDAKSAYLVHVGEEWIGKVLHRLRELHSEEAGSVSGRYLDLTWNKEDRLPTLNGAGLVTAIEEYIQGSMDEYQRRKIEIRETAGDPVPGRMHISTAFDSQEDFWSEAVDFAIGLRAEMPTSSMIFEKDVRFDIPIERVNYDTEGMMQVTDRPTTPGTLVVRNEGNTLRAAFPARIYEPFWLFPGTTIPKQYVKKRVHFEIGDVVVRAASNEGPFDIHFSQAREFRSLQEHANLWQVVRILQEAQTERAVIEILDTEGNAVASGRFPKLSDAQPDRQLLEVARAVENLWFVARWFDISPETKMPLSHIVQQQAVTEQLRQLCDSNCVIDAVMGEVYEEEVGTGFFNSEAAFPFLRRVTFGTIPIVVEVAIAGPLTRGEAESADGVPFKVEKPRRILLRHYVVQDDDEEDRRLEKRLLEELTEELQNQGYEVIKLSSED